MSKTLNKEDYDAHINARKNTKQREFQEYLKSIRGERYQITGKIDEHRNNYTNSEVFFAVDTLDKKLVAIKKIFLEQVEKDSPAEEDYREIRTLNRVYTDEDAVIKKHPEHIVKQIDRWTTKNNEGKLEKLFHVTEYLEYGLSEAIQEKRLPSEGITNLFVMLCDGLGHLHTKVIYRDIKPSNIRCEMTETGAIIPQYIDIGTACGRKGDTTMGLLGTPGYIAPEGIMSEQADIYSLGATLWESTNNFLSIEDQMKPYKDDIEARIKNEFKLQGKVNIEGAEMRQMPNKSGDEQLNRLLKSAEEGRKEVVKCFLDNLKETKTCTKYLTKVIRKAMQPDPTSRYQSASEMKLDLQVAKRSSDLDKVLALYSGFNAAEKGKIAKGENFDLGKLQQACSARKTLYEKLNEQEKKSHLWNVFEQQMLLNTALADVWDGIRKYAEQLGFKKQPGITDVVQHYTQVKQKLFSSYNDPKQRDKVTAFAGQVVQLCELCGDSPNY